MPWFIYQHFVSGGAVWSIMFGTHVLTRFTASLDIVAPAPVELLLAGIVGVLLHIGTAWLALVGLRPAVVVAARQRRIEQVTVVAWLVVPLALMSLGTSKLHHYVYPFVPPVALAVGFAPGGLARAGSGVSCRRS